MRNMVEKLEQYKTQNYIGWAVLGRQVLQRLEAATHRRKCVQKNAATPIANYLILSGKSLRSVTNKELLAYSSYVYEDYCRMPEKDAFSDLGVYISNQGGCYDKLVDAYRELARVNASKREGQKEEITTALIVHRVPKSLDPKLALGLSIVISILTGGVAALFGLGQALMTKRKGHNLHTGNFLLCRGVAPSKQTRESAVVSKL